VAAALARTRGDVAREVPAIARLYLTPVAPPPATTYDASVGPGEP
jgi:hypothetical protein